MNKLLYIALVVGLAGCSSVKKEDKSSAPQKPPEVSSQLGIQKMTSNFKRKGLVMEWGCLNDNKECKNPEVISIEATAYAATNGGSEHMRDAAFKLATLRAKAKLRHFVQEDISSSTVTKVMTRNVEKANETFKVTNSNTGNIVTTDDEVPNQSNTSSGNREVKNTVVRTITEMISSNAAGILRGVYVSDENVIDTNNVSVTVRWDRRMENVNQHLQYRFSN